MVACSTPSRAQRRLAPSVGFVNSPKCADDQVRPSSGAVSPTCPPSRPLLPRQARDYADHLAANPRTLARARRYEGGILAYAASLRPWPEVIRLPSRYDPQHHFKTARWWVAQQSSARVALHCASCGACSLPQLVWPTCCNLISSTTDPFSTPETARNSPIPNPQASGTHI